LNIDEQWNSRKEIRGELKSLSEIMRAHVSRAGKVRGPGIHAVIIGDNETSMDHMEF
jgi:hypothetical protein